MKKKTVVEKLDSIMLKTLFEERDSNIIMTDSPIIEELNQDIVNMETNLFIT